MYAPSFASLRCCAAVTCLRNLRRRRAQLRKQTFGSCRPAQGYATSVSGKPASLARMMRACAPR